MNASLRVIQSLLQRATQKDVENNILWKCHHFCGSSFVVHPSFLKVKFRGEILPKSIPKPAFQPLASKTSRAYIFSHAQVRTTSLSPLESMAVGSPERPSCMLGSQRCVMHLTDLFCCTYGSILAQLGCLPFFLWQVILTVDFLYSLHPAVLVQITCLFMSSYLTETAFFRLCFFSKSYQY